MTKDEVVKKVREVTEGLRSLRSKISDKYESRDLDDLAPVSFDTLNEAIQKLDVVAIALILERDENEKKADVYPPVIAASGEFEAVDKPPRYPLSSWEAAEVLSTRHYLAQDFARDIAQKRFRRRDGTRYPAYRNPVRVARYAYELADELIAFGQRRADQRRAAVDEGYHDITISG